MKLSSRVAVVLFFGVTFGFAADNMNPLARIRCSFALTGDGVFVAGARVRPAGDDVVIRNILKKTTEGGPKVAEQLQALKRECELVGATEFAGVVTAGFQASLPRGKDSVKSISDQTAIPLMALTDGDEAALNLIAIERAVPEQTKAIVVWDIGPTQMRFAMRNPVPSETATYVLGSVPTGPQKFSEDFLKAGAKPTASPAKSVYPLTQQRLKHAIELGHDMGKRVPVRLQAALKNPTSLIVGVGAWHRAIATGLGKGAADHRTSHYFDLVKEYNDAVGKSGDWARSRAGQAINHECYVTGLALQAGVMDQLRIREVLVLDVNLADALLANTVSWPAF